MAPIHRKPDQLIPTCIYTTLMTTVGLSTSSFVSWLLIRRRTGTRNKSFVDRISSESSHSLNL